MDKEQTLKMIEGRIDTIQKLSIECIEFIYNAAYNEGIEAAAKIADDGDEYSATQIRNLKK